jgi:hypothetical protein
MLDDRCTEKKKDHKMKEHGRSKKLGMVFLEDREGER